MKDIIAQIFWTDDAGNRTRTDVSGVPALTKSLKKISHSQPIDEIRHDVSKILSSQSEPVVVDPETLRYLADLIDPFRSRKPGPPEQDLYSHIARAWVTLWTQYREAGHKKPGLVSFIDDALINSGIAPKALRKAKEQHRVLIKKVRSE